MMPPPPPGQGPQGPASQEDLTERLLTAAYMLRVSEAGENEAADAAEGSTPATGADGADGKAKVDAKEWETVTNTLIKHNLLQGGTAPELLSGEGGGSGGAGGGKGGDADASGDAAGGDLSDGWNSANEGYGRGTARRAARKPTKRQSAPAEVLGRPPPGPTLPMSPLPQERSEELARAFDARLSGTAAALLPRPFSCSFFFPSSIHLVSSSRESVP